MCEAASFGLAVTSTPPPGLPPPLGSRSKILQNQTPPPVSARCRSPLVATCLGLADVRCVTMAEGVGIPLENHVAGFVEAKGEASQPADHPPDEAMIDNGLMERRRFQRSLVRGSLVWGSLGVLRRDVGNGVSDALSVVHGGVSITDFSLWRLIALGILIAFGIPQEPLASFQQTRGGEPFIGQDERRGSR